MRKLRTLHEFLMEQLADQEAAVDYLQVTLEEYQDDGDMPFFLREVQRVVEAQGGIAEIAKKIDIAPQVLSDLLSSEKAPRLDMLNTILRGLECRLSIQPLKDADSSADKKYSIAPSESADPNLEVSTEHGDLR